LRLHGETGRDRERQGETGRDRERQRETGRDRERETGRDRERERKKKNMVTVVERTDGFERSNKHDLWIENDVKTTQTRIYS